MLCQNESIGKLGFAVATNVVSIKKEEERERGPLTRLPLIGANSNKSTADSKHGIQRKRNENAIDYRDMIGEIYQDDIEHVASKLRIGLSILVQCDKIISEHLWNEIIQKSNLKYEVLEVNSLDNSNANYSSLLVAQLRLLKSKLGALKPGDVLVIPHLDLLAGGSAVHLSEAGRELAQLLYWNIDNPILAFTDVSFAIPDIISSRFSLLRSITGIPKNLKTEEGLIPTAQKMLTKGELSFFESFNPQELYRIISGMNPIKIRQAITYAISERPSDSLISMKQLKNAILNFKSKTSNFFAVPNVKFSQIGGYHDVKAELEEAIDLIQGHSRGLKDDLRRELTPKGFIFYGPPGTGKTLMAKAVANKLNANVMIVSGPETKDMYVGESERKIREIFADARRNAPSVLVFDEFDSIATKRSDRQDGSASVGNSMVAQILTEMDGFRPEAPVLVIGTTNRLDIIDEALLRPSRFKPISVDLPNNEARRRIVEIYVNKFEISLSEELIDSVAISTSGFNGDEIQFIFKRLAIELNLKSLEIELIPLKLGEIVGEVKYQKEKQSISKNSLNIGLDRRSTYQFLERL